MASGKPDMELTCHQILSQQDSLETFRKLLALSISIFDPETPESDLPSQHQLSTWEDHIALPGSGIFYVTNSASQLLGFFFAVPRTQPEIGHELLHIWLAGVSPASRGLGIFPLLTEKVKQHAKLLGYREMTVCTYPSRFDKMYRILSKNGWIVVAWPEKDEKVLMKLTL